MRGNRWIAGAAETDSGLSLVAMVLGLVVAELGTLGEFDVGVRRNTLQAIMSH